MELLRRRQRLIRRRNDTEDSHGATRRGQREVQGPGAGECCAAASRYLSVLVHPAGDAELAGVVGSRTQLTRPPDQLAVRIRKEHGHPASEDLRDVACRGPEQLVESLLARQLLRHRIERGGPPFPLTRG